MSVTIRRSSSPSCLTRLFGGYRDPRSSPRVFLAPYLEGHRGEYSRETQHRLQNSVMQIAGDAAALGFHGSCADFATKETFSSHGPKVPDNLIEPAKVAMRKAFLRFLRVEQHRPSRRTSVGFCIVEASRAFALNSARVESGGRGTVRKSRPDCRSHPKPSPPFANSQHMEISSESIKNASQRSSGRVSGGKALRLARENLPDEEAFQIVVAYGKTGLLALKRECDFAERPAELTPVKPRSSCSRPVIFREGAGASGCSLSRAAEISNAEA